MATYPSDATISTTAFSIVSSTSYTNTGSLTDFPLGTSAEHVGEVVAIVDGVTQDTSVYTISNSGASISFIEAPQADSLVLRVISLPTRYRTTRSFPTIRSVSYSNTSATVVSGNTYVINGETQNFALPDQLSVTSTDQLLVSATGIIQSDFAYPATNTSPETTLGSISRNLGAGGITIGESNGTTLLLNFETSFSDESDSNQGEADQVDVVLSSTSKFGNSAAEFNGSTSYLSYEDNVNFTYTSSFTIDTFVQFDNQNFSNTIFSHITDANNYIKLSRLSNNKIQFLVRESNVDVVDVQGGTISPSQFYHVAVSHDSSLEDIRLFVDGTLVQKDLSSAITLNPTGNLELGRINFSSSENLDGYLDSFRFVNSNPVYDFDSSFTVPRTALTKIYRPLSNVDSLTIRSFGGTVETFDRFTSMADRKPDRGFQTSTEFDTIEFTSQAGYEKRRLRSRRSKRDFDLSYTNISGVEKTAIEQFYRARSGSFETFTFDLTHINETGTIQARFDGPLSIQHVFSGAANSSLENNFYTVTFKLKEVYD